jgi:hypothetical protein
MLKIRKKLYFQLLRYGYQLNEHITGQNCLVDSQRCRKYSGNSEVSWYLVTHCNRDIHDKMEGWSELNHCTMSLNRAERLANKSLPMRFSKKKTRIPGIRVKFVVKKKYQFSCSIIRSHCYDLSICYEKGSGKAGIFAP